MDRPAVERARSGDREAMAPGRVSVVGGVPTVFVLIVEDRPPVPIPADRRRAPVLPRRALLGRTRGVASGLDDAEPACRLGTYLYSEQPGDGLLRPCQQGAAWPT